MSNDNVDNSIRTSCIELISSTHGKQRRLERDISKKDLQIAVKCGLIEKEIFKKGFRYKITYDNIVYITDETMTKEVTSYSTVQLPLESFVIDKLLSRQIIEQRRRLKEGIVAITSHTVIIIDQSTSMNNSDVIGHRSRSRSFYYQIANEMVAGPLIREQLAFTDVLTIIEMRENATVNPNVYMEPVTWELHNKLVDLANDPLRGKGPGNYLPALSEALNVLQRTDTSNCALLLMFLSDSSLCNKQFKKGTRMFHSQQAIHNVIRQICDKFKKRLTFGAFGFAYDHSGDLFQLMKSMTATAMESGSNAVFSLGIDTQCLRKALRDMSTSLISTRSSLSSIISGSLLKSFDEPKGKVRRLQHMETIRDNDDNDDDNDDDDVFDISKYEIYGESGNFKRYSYFLERNQDKLIFNKTSPYQHPNARGLAVKKVSFAEGSERYAFKCTEIDSNRNPIGQPLIAKKSKLYGEKDQLEFHKISGRTQTEARRLSKKFNKMLELHELTVPKISFLKVSFYTIWNGSVCTDAYLIEKSLDPKRYKKYNDNQGGVISVPRKMEPFDSKVAGRVKYQEESNEDETKDHDMTADRIIDDDVPQAFSHWSYQYTYGDLLICDLQGELKTDFFCLTDPAINSNKKRLYGLTDRGENGQKRFFQGHQCNPLCRMLRLRTPIIY